MSWSKIEGHERWLKLFREAAARQRLAHAYLFVGPRGVGKRMFALELAKALLCERTTRDQLEACGQCEACLLVDARTHPDFFLIEKPPEANEVKIELMRELCQGFSLKTGRGHGRVAIVDDADDLNEDSANCFLKTLEEPPPRSIFILIGTSLDGQLPTIRSRCQIIRFAPLPEATMRSILAKQEITDPPLVARLVKLAAGSPGKGLGLAEPALWGFRGELLRGLAQPKIDSVGLGRRFTDCAEDAGKESAAQRRRAGQALSLLIEAWNDVLARQHTEAPPSDPAEAALLEPLARRARPDQILRILERCLEAEAQLDRYVQVSLVVEALVDALAQILESP